MVKKISSLRKSEFHFIILFLCFASPPCNNTTVPSARVWYMGRLVACSDQRMTRRHTVSTDIQRPSLWPLCLLLYVRDVAVALLLLLDSVLLGRSVHFDRPTLEAVWKKIENFVVIAQAKPNTIVIISSF